VAVYIAPANVFNLVGNATGGGQQAINLNATQTVLPNGTVAFEGKDAILLNPGFKTKTNALFKAQIKN
jgi:hypothetical protein